MKQRTTVLAVALCAAASTLACDKVPLLAPTSSTITVTAPVRTLQLGESTEVTAFVLEQSGTPVQNGTTVRFSTSLGTVSPAEAQTRNGSATTTFSAGSNSGTAEIRATSGSATGGTATPATNLVSITIGGAAATAVTVTTTPSVVPSTGGTSTVSAVVTDAAGNRLRGIPVTFSTSAGTLSSTTGTTDENGEARVQLTTNRNATVTVRAGNVAAVTATVNISAPASFALGVTPAAPTAGAPVTLTVTPTVAAGTPPPRVTVDWGDGSTAQDLGVVSAARTVTHVYSTPGAYTIVATATSDGETTSNSIGVVIGARPAPTLTAAATTGTTATTFSFTVTPATTGLPVRDVTINFGDDSSVDLGAITTATTVTHRYGSTGSYTVRATQTDSSGATATAVVVVTVTAP